MIHLDSWKRQKVSRAWTWETSKVQWFGGSNIEFKILLLFFGKWCKVCTANLEDHKLDEFPLEPHRKLYRLKVGPVETNCRSKNNSKFEFTYGFGKRFITRMVVFVRTPNLGDLLWLLDLLQIDDLLMINWMVDHGFRWTLNGEVYQACEHHELRQDLNIANLLYDRRIQTTNQWRPISVLENLSPPALHWDFFREEQIQNEETGEVCWSDTFPI